MAVESIECGPSVLQLTLAEWSAVVLALRFQLGWEDTRNHDPGVQQATQAALAKFREALR